MTDRRPVDPSHKFGGAWTEQKLRVLAGYLRAYATALKNQPFKRWYIDAFAGTGFRSDSETAIVQRGSAKIALDTVPRFDRFLFIEKDQGRCNALEELRANHPELADRIEVVGGDANRILESRCAEGWKDRRAVLFLDPYATELRWSTIEAVARSEVMDTWILFPLMAANRMLTRTGRIPDSWRQRLDDLLGTRGWFDRVYRIQPQKGLFGDDEVQLLKRRAEEIGGFFLDRLKQVFAAVGTPPKVLCNSRGSPLFMLCFAVGNPRAAKTALKIANHLLGKNS
jgi:three-Cys-motif partner protein